jgi:hypothetical protein
MTLRPDERAMQLLRERELTCAELGAMIWGSPARNSQAYARPAGAMLKRLEKFGLVRWRRDYRGVKVWSVSKRGTR